MNRQEKESFIQDCFVKTKCIVCGKTLASHTDNDLDVCVNDLTIEETAEMLRIER